MQIADTPDPVERLIKDEGRNFAVKNKRWFLVCLAMTQFGFFYNVSAVTALQKPVQDVLNINEFQYSLIILAQGLPNLFVPILTGVVIDRYGASLGLAAGMFFGLIGQLLLTFAVFSNHYYLFLLGTILCYMGVEILFLGKNKMIRIWCKDNEIPGVTSISIFIQSVAVILCDVTYPTIYSYTGSLGLPFAIGLGVCSISLLFGTLKINLHQRYLKCAHNQKLFQEPPKLMDSIRAMKKFPLLYWVVMAGACITLGAYTATKAFESKFLMITFQFPVEQAGFILASGLVGSGVFGPLAGILLDRTGKLSKGFMISTFTVMAGITLNAMLPECERCLTPTIPFIMMVLGSAVRGIVVISSVMRLVPPKNVGFAMSLLSTMTAIVNVSWPPVAGAISQATIDQYKYYWVFVANASLAAVGFSLAIITHLMDIFSLKRLQKVLPGSKNASFYSVEGLFEGASFHEPKLAALAENDDKSPTMGRSWTEHMTESTLARPKSSVHM